MRVALRFALSAGLVAHAGSAFAADAAAVSFSRDIAPVLKANCATCHLTGQEAGNMALYPSAAYASLVDVPSVESKLLRVKPGSPQQSYLMLKLDGNHLDAGGTGARMPLGQPPLDDATLDRIRAWIAEGAAKN